MSAPTTEQRRPVSAATALVVAAVLVAASACNVWPGGLGRVALPYDDRTTDSIDPRGTIVDPEAKTETIDEGVAQIREREPKAADAPPREVAELSEPLVEMSVEDLRWRVLAGNLDLRVVLLEPEIAARRVSAEEGRFDAIFGGSARYTFEDRTKRNSELVSFDPLDNDPLLAGREVKFTELEQEIGKLDLGVGVKVPLPTGGTIGFDSYFSNKRVQDPEDFDEYLTATRFSISHPLLRNAGRDVTLASIRLARAEERLTRLKTKLAAMRILARAEKAYWKLYATRRILEVRAEQFRVANENLRLVRLRVQEQVTAPIEIQRAQAGVASRLEGLVIAGTQWRLQQRELKTFLASDDLPLWGEPMVEITSEPTLVGLDLDPQRLVETALDERLDLIALEVALVQDGIRIDRDRNRTLPIANLDFSYGLTSRDTETFATAWTDQWDFENDELTVGVTFAVPFTNQRPRANLETAYLQRAARLATKQARILRIRREVFDNVQILQQNWQRILAARQNVVVAGQVYDLEKRQFEVGTRTQREVLEALADLGEAQIREIKAVLDYQVSQIDLAFATGTLLGYSRVDLAPLDLPEPDLDGLR